MVTTTVWWCHPLADSFTAAVAATVANTAAAHGPTDTIDMYRDTHVPGGGDLLVCVHPTWWSAEPAAALQRYEALAGHPPRYRSLMTVSTHGSPRWVNMAEGRNARRNARRNIAPLIGAERSLWVAMYAMDRADADARAAHMRSASTRVNRELTRLSQH